MKPKNISKEEYVKIFCHDRRIRDRKVVYVSTETHNKLRFVAHLLRHEYVTVASLADAILDHHLKTYNPLFIEFERQEALMPWVTQPKLKFTPADIDDVPQEDAADNPPAE